MAAHPGNSTTTATTAEQPLTVTIRQASKISGLSESSIYRLIDNRDLATVKVGRRTLVKYPSLATVLDKGIAQLRDTKQRVWA